MILPTGASSFKEAMKMGVEVYHNLKVSKRQFNLLVQQYLNFLIYRSLYPWRVYSDVASVRRA